MSAPLRWGVVGTGGISRQVASDFAFVDGSEVVAVSSRSRERGDAFAREFGMADRSTGLADLLASDVDAVYIGTPHATHFDIAAQAIGAGKHVLCEKPLGMNAEEVRELTRLAHEAGVFLMEAMWMVFTPLNRRLVEHIKDGKLGDIRAVQASFGAAFPEDGSSRSLPGGSALLDQGIYPVTLTHMLLGRPDAIEAAGTVREDGVDLRGHYTFTYSDDRFAHGAYSMVDWLDQSATVGGTQGSADLGRGFWFSSRMTLALPGLAGPPREEVVEVEREGNGYVPMLRAVSTAILEGSLEHPLHPAADTVEVFEILDEIRQKVEAGLQ